MVGLRKSHEISYANSLALWLSFQGSFLVHLPFLFLINAQLRYGICSQAKCEKLMLAPKLQYELTWTQMNLCS